MTNKNSRWQTNIRVDLNTSILHLSRQLQSSAQSHHHNSETYLSRSISKLLIHHKLHEIHLARRLRSIKTCIQSISHNLETAPEAIPLLFMTSPIFCMAAMAGGWRLSFSKVSRMRGSFIIVSISLALGGWSADAKRRGVACIGRVAMRMRGMAMGRAMILRRANMMRLLMVMMNWWGWDWRLWDEETISKWHHGLRHKVWGDAHYLILSSYRPEVVNLDLNAKLIVYSESPGDIIIFEIYVETII